MKYQFRSNPPNGDIVLDRAGNGYEAPDEASAWRALAYELSPPMQTVTHLQSRYVLEPFSK